MNKIKLSTNGAFTVEEITVLSKNKRGRFLEFDSEGKQVFENLTSLIWKTSEGNFNVSLLDKPRYINKEFVLYSEGDIATAKNTLRQFAEETFNDIQARLSERIQSLRYTSKNWKPRLRVLLRPLKC